MKMTRQHFQALANMCANILSCLDNRTDRDYEMIMSQFVMLGRDANPNFDRDRFVSWVEEKINQQTQGE